MLNFDTASTIRLGGEQYVGYGRLKACSLILSFAASIWILLSDAFFPESRVENQYLLRSYGARPSQLPCAPSERTIAPHSVFDRA
jgi:hypothetical protein